MKPYITRNEVKESVAFTGYRPQKLPFGNNPNHPDAIKLRASLKTEYDNFIQAGFRRFYTGGAIGSDMMAAEVILELKEEYADRVKIGHFLCLPCLEHDSKWGWQDKERLERIAEKSNVIYVNEKPYFNGCMQMRNCYMVDASLFLLAVYDGQSGGTRNTVEYAKSKGHKVFVINPRQPAGVELVEPPRNINFMSEGYDNNY